MKRIMRLLTRPNVGGPTRQAICLWHAHKKLGMRTLLVVGKCDPDEAALDLAGVGIPEMTPEAAVHRGQLAEGFVVIPQMRRRPSPMHDPPALRAICRMIRSFQPQVLHSHTTKAGFLGRHAGREEEVPVVAHTFHGHVLRSYFWKPMAGLLRRVERRLAPKSKLLFAVSPSCARELEELDVVPRGKIRVVPPAVVTAPFAAVTRAEARARMKVPEDQWLVASVGRLVPIKRMDCFLDALREFDDIIGHLYGEGPLLKKLTPKAYPNGRLMGLTQNLPASLAAYDALVIASEREGCPVVGVEAFAAKVPVVGFDVPGVEDLLRTWGGGVLVSRDRGPEGLAEGLRRLRKNRELRHAVIAAGHASLPRFSPTTVAKTLLEAYESELSSR